MADRPRVPPGQIRTDRWPILHAGTLPADLTPERWTLRVHGEVERPTTLSFQDLLALPQKEITCDIHCVTSWTKLGMNWKGVLFTAIADAVAPRPTVRFVVMECEQGFTTSLPYEALRGEDVLVAHTVDGTPLPTEHGGPVRMLVPKRYFYKSAKWLRGLKFVQNDEPGFWEVRGYSNIADPWTEKRYDVDDVKEIHRMRKLSLFRPLTPKNEP
ncbi:MAG TPA: molybdopterin-dependent oxidoreductase [Thermoplasmata archaeon]|nr:molybdopterin-dependent oxidoreductase [Thermoplasmata archaeon]